MFVVEGFVGLIRHEVSQNLVQGFRLGNEEGGNYSSSICRRNFVFKGRVSGQFVNFESNFTRF